jgi:hypothetical protein
VMSVNLAAWTAYLHLSGNPQGRPLHILRNRSPAPRESSAQRIQKTADGRVGLQPF